MKIGEKKRRMLYRFLKFSVFYLENRERLYKKVKTEESIFFPPQGRGSPTWRTTWPTLLRTMEIPMSVTAYNGKPYNSFLTGFFFACPLCGTSCCVFFGQARSQSFRIIFLALVRGCVSPHPMRCVFAFAPFPFTFHFSTDILRPYPNARRD